MKTGTLAERLSTHIAVRVLGITFRQVRYLVKTYQLR